MSGEAVVLMGVGSGVAGVALAAGAALLAAHMVAQWMQAQHEEALRNAQREQEASEAWLAFQHAEQREIEQLTRQHAALRDGLAALSLAEPTPDDADAAGAPRKGFLDTSQGEMSTLLRSLLTPLPAELVAGAAAPLHRLERQARELERALASATPPAPETLAAFRSTLRRSAEAILDGLEREAVARERLLARLRALLGEAIACHGLAREPASREELSQLRERLLGMLSIGEVTAAAVELLETRLRQLRTQVDAELEQAAIAATLRERLHHHLADLGYRPRPAAGAPEEWEIPGGERLRLALQPGNRLAFQLVHERDTVSDRPLSAAELAFLRAQEGRWCSDLHALLQRLQADGFAFQVQLERQTPGEAIPVVMVEDVEEWLEEDEEERRDGAPLRRRLP
jgi:hypothetical protein